MSKWSSAKPAARADASSHLRRLPPSTRRLVLATGLVLVAAAVFTTLFPPRVLRELEYFSYDVAVRFLEGSRLPPSEVAVVDVDERSLAALGQWPWPRYRIAALLDKTFAAGARSIAVDFLFVEPDRLSLRSIQEQYRRDRGIAVQVQAPAEAFDNDALFAQAIAKGPVVMGAYMAFREPMPGPVSLGRPVQIALRAAPGTPGAPPLPYAQGMTAPLPRLAEAAWMVAAANTMPDSDGKVRRMPLLTRWEDHYVPGLALAAVLAARHERRLTVEHSSAGLSGVRLAERFIPTDHQGNLLLPFRAGMLDRFERISAADLLEGRIQPDQLRGKIVFLGSSARGLQDTHATPILRETPGLTLHALAADAILRRDFRQAPSWARALETAIVLAGGLAVTFLLAYAPITLAALAAAALGAAQVLGLHALLVRAGLHVSHVPGLATLVVLFLILVLVRTRREEKRVLQGLRDLSKAQDCALLGLASIAETRDPETGRHILRTQHFVRALADCLGRLPRFRSQLTPEDIEAMTKSAPLHDVGKVGIPDHILLKSGQLTEEEYAIMKRHTTIGHDALKRAEEMAGVPTGVSFLRYARQVSANHHERWDGQGYPNGLSREDIPLSARLMALADVYDAIRSRRVYKPPLSHEQARAFICAGKGTQFDPDVVDAFLACEKTFQEITERYADPPEEASDAAPPDAPCTDYLGRP